jgi:hypothetical protein
MSLEGEGGYEFAKEMRKRFLSESTKQRLLRLRNTGKCANVSPASRHTKRISGLEGDAEDPSTLERKRARRRYAGLHACIRRCVCSFMNVDFLEDFSSASPAFPAFSNAIPTPAILKGSSSAKERDASHLNEVCSAVVSPQAAGQVLVQSVT